MFIRGVTRAQLEAACTAADVRPYNLRPSGSGWRLQIHTVPPTERGQAIRWKRHSPQGRRVVGGAVCWHGHRAFMRALYALAPEAIIQTSLATYRGAEDFEQRHEDTYDGRGVVVFTGNPNLGHEPYGALCECR